MAEIQLQAVDYREILHGGKPQSELAESNLKHAKALQSLTQSGPKHLKFFALIARQSAELENMVQENSSLMMVFHQHVETGGNPIMILGAYARRSVLARRIAQKYGQCVRLARYAADYHDRWALARALTGIVNDIARYIITLSSEGNQQAASAFAMSALQICKLSAWIAAETGDTDAIIMAMISALTTVNTEDSDAYRWAEQVANGLNDPTARADAVRYFERAKKRWKGEKVEGDYHGDTIWQVVQNIATGIGIDITDENSPLVRQLRIAARDNKPDRVLVNCEHLLATPGARGPAAREVQRLTGLDTAGSKVVHCTLHDYHAEAKDLDSAYSELKANYCDSCGDAKPRSRGWTYDMKARWIERVRFSGFMARFLGKPYGPRDTRPILSSAVALARAPPPSAPAWTAAHKMVL